MDGRKNRRILQSSVQVNGAVATDPRHSHRISNRVQNQRATLHVCYAGHGAGVATARTVTGIVVEGVLKHQALNAGRQPIQPDIIHIDEARAAALDADGQRCDVAEVRPH
jgi:hypothetical protein